MKRREFLKLTVGAAGVALLPPIAVSVSAPAAAAPKSKTGYRPPNYIGDFYDCNCGLVRYWHFSADHFDGQRMTYALHRKHEHLHRAMAAEKLRILSGAKNEPVQA